MKSINSLPDLGVTWRRFIVIPTVLAYALRMAAFLCMAVNTSLVFDEMAAPSFALILIYAITLSVMGWLCLQMEPYAYIVMKNSRVRQWALIKFDNWDDYHKFINTTSPSDLEYLASLSDEKWAAFDLEAFTRSDS